jgi:hypothetical protein
LAAGMQSLAGTFAKIIRYRAHENLKGPKKGSVFKGRYHLHILRTPTEMKNSLEYVLLNNSKHRKFIEHLDSFSSGKFFNGWKKLLGRRFSKIIKVEVEFLREQEVENVNSILSSPQSWLCKSGWEKACS